ncbi:MAG: mechanosensitive ion channel protein MscS, partial [Desulfobacteraceae bacterium 4572_35.1]
MYKIILPLLMCCFVLLPPAIGADDAGNSKPVPDPVSYELASPRATMTTFLHAMDTALAATGRDFNHAMQTMDLSEINPLIRQQKGEELARILLTIMRRTRTIELEAIPDRTTGAPYLFKEYSRGRIEIVRQTDGRWLFSSTSVRDLPQILALFPEAKSQKDQQLQEQVLPFNMKLRQAMPVILQQKLLLEYWQWLGIFLAIVLGLIADKIVVRILRSFIGFWKRRHSAYSQIDPSLLRPLGLIAMALVWWAGMYPLGLPDAALLVLIVPIKVLVGVAGIWSAFRLIDVVNDLLTLKAEQTENRFDDLLVPLLRKSLKLFVSVVGVVFVADNLNVDVTSLLAGLGLGGLAFALAAKDMIGNLFGSVTVVMDRPFHIGDWVVIGDVEGTVENVGFRSTRIRTFYNSLVSLPNAQLTTTKIDNMGARKYRRMKTLLNLTYDTPPERIEAFCAGIRKLVQLHPYMRKDYYHVYLNQFGAASVDILVYVFWQTPDWGTELQERHRF